MMGVLKAVEFMEIIGSDALVPRLSTCTKSIGVRRHRYITKDANVAWGSCSRTEHALAAPWPMC